MPFDFVKLRISDVILVKPKVFVDERGFFTETYKMSDFFANGIEVDFFQDNHSKSSKGVLRGLHYQIAPKPQAKLVRCVKGEIFDVAVDIRKGSETFGQWVGAKLSGENRDMLYIPEGFAHGFVVLSDDTEILYKVSNEFCAQCDRGIRWNDPDIAVDWGIDFEPVLSKKDAMQPLLKEIQELL